jgi:hypothetical protein
MRMSEGFAFEWQSPGYARKFNGAPFTRNSLGDGFAVSRSSSPKSFMELTTPLLSHSNMKSSFIVFSGCGLDIVKDKTAKRPAQDAIIRESVLLSYAPRGTKSLKKQF